MERVNYHMCRNNKSPEIQGICALSGAEILTSPSLGGTNGASRTQCQAHLSIVETMPIDAEGLRGAGTITLCLT